MYEGLVWELRCGLEVGIAGIDSRVDRAFLVSVEDFRDICDAESVPAIGAYSSATHRTKCEQPQI